MCGITGYVGARPDSVRIVLDNLRRLEYRGYDSAGIAVVSPGQPGVAVVKKQGKLSNLEQSINGLGEASGTVIAHTRWATHGRPSDENAHPHCDCRGKIAIIHNGIIENYLDLRESLVKEGHIFSSETDTEVLAHLIESRHSAIGGSLEAAIRAALSDVTGAYAICVISDDEPGVIYAAKTASPLIIGLGDGENFLASDIPAVMGHTRRVIVLEDGDFARITSECVELSTVAGAAKSYDVLQVTWDLSTAQKGGYPHFMLKEIHEEPQTIRATLRGRITDDGRIALPEMALDPAELSSFSRIVIVGCGTAYHAGVVGKSFYEKLLRVPVEVIVASEFRYSNPIVDKKTLAVIISQSGETADTLAALREARSRGAVTIAIVNVVGSSIAREAAHVIYTHAGPEISVCSTKAYITQLTVLYLIGLFMAQQQDKVESDQLSAYADALKTLPDLVASILSDASDIEELGRQLARRSCFFFLGRGFDYAASLEAALKLKEITYIHAEAYPAGEMKHGPLALVDHDVAVVCFATQPALYDKMLSNIKEVKARDGFALAVVKQGDEGVDCRSVDAIIGVPSTLDEFMPVLSAVPMQLMAYYIATALDRDIDQPRNLAKSVTVE